MRHKTWNALTGLMLVFLLAGCQSLTGKTAGENIDDAAITASVQTKLVREKASNFTRIDVDTNEGVVHLNGTVASTEDKIGAEDLARSVKGVRNVVNNLQIARR